MRQMNIAKVVLLFVIFLSQSWSAAAQNNVADAETLVREWFTRLNGLSTWFISMEGKEELAEPVNRMVELYRSDVLQFVPPNEEQMGTVTFSGLKGVRQWAEQFARTYVELGYRIDPQGSGDQSATVV